MNAALDLLPSNQEMQRAFRNKDQSYDGIFFVGVKTTGIFCRPSCPSRPAPENVQFFASIKECLLAGYRPCRRCRPMEAHGTPPPWAAALMERVESSPGSRLNADDWKNLGVTPERARRWFKSYLGMSFAAWCRGRRMASAFTRLREGASVDEVTFASGYESHSGFREAFVQRFGKPPGRARFDGQRVTIALMESPMGAMLAGGSEVGLCLLEFADRRMLETNLERLHRRMGCALVPGEIPVLAQLRSELAEYFSGDRRDFDVPLEPCGTAFQQKVWTELRRIPHGETISYDELARRIGQPTAQRAVARANGMNRICILIPCHRVIGKDGSLTGYGGGLWRKRLLLELERTGPAETSR
jgi:AraC family transcriptional regulator of adaptative response/methylated-DNA-[protein]-cysteine methyltransferase